MFVTEMYCDAATHAGSVYTLHVRLIVILKKTNESSCTQAWFCDCFGQEMITKDYSVKFIAGLIDINGSQARNLCSGPYSLKIIYFINCIVGPNKIDSWITLDTP